MANMISRRLLGTVATRAVSIVPRKDFLRVAVDQDHHDFHWFWLKHNCDNVPLSLHPQTKERLVDSSEISLDIQPHTVALKDPGNDPTIEVVWDAERSHVSVYKLSWLQKHAYGTNHKEVLPPSNDLKWVTLNYPDFVSNGKPQGRYFGNIEERLRKYGLVVVRNHGLDTEAIIDQLLPANASVIETHFGRIEDLRTDNTTNKNTDQLGYTNAAVNLHTDQPFIDNPPGMQLLQSIRKADTGGANFLVDSRQAALYLQERDPEAYHILTTTPITFYRKQKAFESKQVLPIIQLDEARNIKQIRHSYFSMAPHQVPFDRMRSFYRAYNAYSDILRNPQHHFQFMLESGDFVLYDNYRMLHARTNFTGPRHVRGVYFNHTDVWRKLAESKD